MERIACPGCSAHLPADELCPCDSPLCPRCHLSEHIDPRDAA